MSEDTAAERARCRAILGKILTNPTPANMTAAIKAIGDGTAAEAFEAPDPTTGSP